MKYFSFIALSLALAAEASPRVLQHASFTLQNGQAALALNQKFASLSTSSPCTPGETACVNNEFAQCVNGKFILRPCAGGLICAALPLVDSPGTSVTCTTAADCDARIAATGASGIQRRDEDDADAFAKGRRIGGGGTVGGGGQAPGKPPGKKTSPVKTQPGTTQVGKTQGGTSKTTARSSPSAISSASTVASPASKTGVTVKSSTSAATTNSTGIASVSSFSVAPSASSTNVSVSSTASESTSKGSVNTSVSNAISATTSTSATASTSAPASVTTVGNTGGITTASSAAVSSGATLSTTTTANGTTTASTPNSSSTGGATNSNDPQSSLTLVSSVIASGFAQDGQETPTPNQVPSLTSTNNFINFCASAGNLPITNGKQITTGSCNPAPMGILPATTNMPAAKFVSPANLGTVPANTNFTVKMAIANLETGHFVNAAQNYFAAPQVVNAQGVIQGHSHIVIQRLESLSQTTPADPASFAFFKGLNDVAQAGVLSTEVAGLPAGFYRMASINSAANHQPVLVAVAQHGALDDMI
ncbi:hypothetical protein BD413DRAFT_628239 [Trametes elegans]|nr:hypothetical protein BD413DRAFT_628239 [Trametes elegans]